MEENRPVTRRETHVSGLAFLDLKFDPPLSACIIEDPAASSIHDAVIAVAETHLQNDTITRAGPSLGKAISFPDKRGSLVEPRFKSEAFTEFHRRCQLAADPSPSGSEKGGEAAFVTGQDPLVDQSRPQTSSTVSGLFSTGSSTSQTQTTATTPSPDHSHARNEAGRGKRISHQELHRVPSGSTGSNTARAKRVSTVASSPTKTSTKSKLAFFETGKWRGGQKDRTGVESGLVRSMSMLGFRGRGKKPEKDEDKRAKDPKGEIAIMTKIALKRSSRMIGASAVEEPSSKKQAVGDKGKRKIVEVDEDIPVRPSNQANGNVTRNPQDDFREFFFFDDRDDSSESSSSSRCSTTVHPCSRGNIDNSYSNNHGWLLSSALATASIPIPPKSPRRQYIYNERTQLRALTSPAHRVQRVSWGSPPRPLPLRLTPAIPRWKRPLPPTPPSPPSPQQEPQQQQRQQEWEQDPFEGSEHALSHFSHPTSPAVDVFTTDDTRTNADRATDGRRRYSRRHGSDGLYAGDEDEYDAEEEEEGGEVVVALAQEVTFHRPVIVQHGSSFCGLGSGGGGGGGISSSSTDLNGSASAILDTSPR